MPAWTTLSLSELRASNKGQIVAAVAQYLNSKTKKEVIELLMDTEIFHRAAVIVRRPDGQMESIETEMEDSLGDKIGSTRLEFSYYDTGEVHIIESEKLRITHFRNGRQPEILWLTN